MKIGITCYPTYGGSGAVATELGLELARRGHEVHFITYDSPFRLRGATQKSPPRRRMPSTCLRTYLQDWAYGRSQYCRI